MLESVAITATLIRAGGLSPGTAPMVLWKEDCTESVRCCVECRPNVASVEEVDQVIKKHVALCRRGWVIDVTSIIAVAYFKSSQRIITYFAHHLNCIFFLRPSGVTAHAPSHPRPRFPALNPTLNVP